MKKITGATAVVSASIFSCYCCCFAQLLTKEKAKTNKNNLRTSALT
jgi:hypothetical protein